MSESNLVKGRGSDGTRVPHRTQGITCPGSCVVFECMFIVNLMRRVSNKSGRENLKTVTPNDTIVSLFSHGLSDRLRFADILSNDAETQLPYRKTTETAASLSEPDTVWSPCVDAAPPSFPVTGSWRYSAPTLTQSFEIAINAFILQGGLVKVSLGGIYDVVFQPPLPIFKR